MNLIKYDAACTAIAEAKAIDEVKDIRDKAEALKHYARQAKNKDLELDAAEIRLRAERRMGEMLAQQKAEGGLNQGGRPSDKTGSKSEPVLPRLSDAGIDKKMSSRAQKLAAVPEEQFEAAITDLRDSVKNEGARVTTNLLAIGEKHASSVEKQEAAPNDEPSELEQLREQYAELAAINERLEALAGGQDEAAALIADLQKRLKRCQDTLKTVEIQRDEYMRENSQLKRQVKGLQRQLDRRAA